MARRKGLGGMAGDVERDRIERRSGVGAASRRVEVGLTQETLEALAQGIAQRVTQLLEERDSQRQPELLTAGELARKLRVERSWVYRHRHLLGGERIGDGPKAQWRFELDTARRRLAKHWAAPGIEGGL